MIARLGVLAFWAVVVWHLAVIVAWEALKRRVRMGLRKSGGAAQP